MGDTPRRSEAEPRQPLSEITEQDWDEIVAIVLESLNGQAIKVNGGWSMS